MRGPSAELGAIAQRWFEVMRDCGDDVRELLHDGHPTACVGDAAFGYVNAFTAHVNVGFFRGAELADPAGLLEGTGKFMRHVKLRPERDVDDVALTRLIETAYADMKRRCVVVASQPDPGLTAPEPVRCPSGGPVPPMLRPAVHACATKACARHRARPHAVYRRRSSFT